MRVLLLLIAIAAAGAECSTWAQQTVNDIVIQRYEGHRGKLHVTRYRFEAYGTFIANGSDIVTWCEFPVPYCSDSDPDKAMQQCNWWTALHFNRTEYGYVDPENHVCDCSTATMLSPGNPWQYLLCLLMLRMLAI